MAQGRHRTSNDWARDKWVRWEKCQLRRPSVPEGVKVPSPAAPQGRRQLQVNQRRLNGPVAQPASHILDGTPCKSRPKFTNEVQRLIRALHFKCEIPPARRRRSGEWAWERPRREVPARRLYPTGGALAQASPQGTSARLRWRRSSLMVTTPRSSNCISRPTRLFSSSCIASMAARSNSSSKSG